MVASWIEVHRQKPAVPYCYNPAVLTRDADAIMGMRRLRMVRRLE